MRDINFFERILSAVKKNQSVLLKADRNQSNNKQTGPKRGKTRVTKSHMIGWKGGANFLDQSQNEMKQKQCNFALF